MTELFTLLANPNKIIAFILEFEDSTGVTHRYQTPNRGATSEGYPDYLINPGSRSDRLEADDLSSIVPSTSSPFILSNPRSSVAGTRPLDILKSRSLANRTYTLYAGAAKQSDGTPAELIASYEIVSKGVIDREPVFSGDIIEIRSKSALERLNTDLQVNSYVGEPAALHTLISGTRATVAHNAAHSLTSFTLAGRYQPRSFAGTVRLSDKSIAVSTNSNWFIRVLSSGILSASYTVSGVPSTWSTVTALTLNNYIYWVFARRDGHLYLMINGVIVAESTSPGVPDLPATSIFINQASAGNGRILDNRIYNSYISPDDMRSHMLVRATGNEPGLVGLYRGDDYTGNTLTDYSPTGAHAVISGVENTDFEWISSGLGTEELSGKSMPVIIGNVFHATADLVDPTLEVWRVNDREIDPWSSSIVRDEGEELSSSTDYDLVAGEELTSLLIAEAGEPLTIGIAYDAGQAQLDRVIGGDLTSTEYGSLLVDRGPVSPSDLDVTGLHSLYPNDLGIHTRRTNLMELMRLTLHGMGAHAYNSLGGKVTLDALVPPTSPGPRSLPCVEIISAPNEISGITWDTNTTVVNSESFTLAGWFKLHRSWNSDDPFGDIPLMRLYDSGNNELRWNIDSASGQSRMELEFYFSATKQSESGASFLFNDPLGEWWFLAVSNTSGESARFYAGRLGGTLRLVGTTTALSFSPFPTPTFDTVQIGGDLSSLQAFYPFFRGGVAEPRVWNLVKTIAQLDLYFRDTVVSHSGRTFQSLLNGLSTAAKTDIVTSTVGIVTNKVFERPDLIVDLNNTPMQFITRNIRPADRIEIKYRKNYRELSPSEIVATVPDSDSVDLQQDSRSIPWDDPSISAEVDGNLDPVQITLDSPWYTEVGANGTLRLVKYRSADGREIAELKHNTSEQSSVFERQLMIIQIGHEIKVIDDEGNEYTYRLIGNDYRFIDQVANVGLFR